MVLSQHQVPILESPNTDKCCIATDVSCYDFVPTNKSLLTFESNRIAAGSLFLPRDEVGWRLYACVEG